MRKVRKVDFRRPGAECGISLIPHSHFPALFDEPKPRVVSAPRDGWEDLTPERVVSLSQAIVRILGLLKSVQLPPGSAVAR